MLEPLTFPAVQSSPAGSQSSKTSQAPVQQPVVQPHENRPVLKGTVQESQYLPPEMYGAWNVTATLMETNNENAFGPVLNELWALEQNTDHVVLKNIANGAYAVIDVQQVQGNRASFRHKALVPNSPMLLLEAPTVAVSGNRMAGFSVNRLLLVDRQGTIQRSWWAKYRLDAVRISNASARFETDRSSGTVNDQGEPEFTIEPVRKEADYVKQALPALPPP